MVEFFAIEQSGAGFLEKCGLIKIFLIHEKYSQDDLNDSVDTALNINLLKVRSSSSPKTYFHIKIST